MSNSLPDPDSLLTLSGTPVDAVNSMLNRLNPTANGLNGANGLSRTPTRKDSGEEAGPRGGQQGDGGVVKANKGMILRKSVEYITWVCFLLLTGVDGWMGLFASVVQLEFILSAEIIPTPTFFPNQPILTPPFVLSRCLQQFVTVQGARNHELEQKLKAYQHRSCSEPSMEPPLTNSAGTVRDSMILHGETAKYAGGGRGWQ